MTQKILTTMVLAFALVALSTNGCATRERTGQLIGGAAGAAAGTQVGSGTGTTIATIGGALLGAAIGGVIGRNMDQRDFQQTSHALETTPTGEPVQWVNPDTGHQYTVTPTHTYQSAQGPCREYQMHAVVDGRNETLTGTACRQPDGSWQAIS